MYIRYHKESLEFWGTTTELHDDPECEYVLDSRDEDIDLRERERLKLRGLEEFIASLQSIAKQKEIEKKRKWVF